MGFTLGRTAKTVSPTSPLDVDATPDSLIAITSNAPRFTTAAGTSSQSPTPRSEREHTPFRKTRSNAVTNAQTFGAQYAWLSPRVKGKRRLSSCGSWPMRRKGPSETRKTAMTAFAREMKRVGRSAPEGAMQKERRR